MQAYHTGRGVWSFMVHGTAFLRYNAQDLFERGSRGGRMVDMPNWVMLAAHRTFSSRSKLTLRGMVTLDPLTVGANGYPLLFQTGEFYENQPLIDRQHPHDLFAELALVYALSFSEEASVFIYAALPGEPALGPSAFMHRPSAQHNPNAPLGHHWQDATHIVFGVTTVGVRYGIFKLDGSLFTGREPDDERFGFDRPRFDSYSARLSVNPIAHLSFQVSRGSIRKPELLEPGIDKIRTTASALFVVPVAGKGVWSSAVIWGMNQPRSEHGGGSHGRGSQHAFLLETDVTLGKQAVYSRAEWVQKSPEELGFEEGIDRERLTVGALTLGTARNVLSTGGVLFTLGVQGTVYHVPEALRFVYGAQPVSGQVYLQLSPDLR